MTVSVTSDLTTLTGAESTSDSGTWARVNGTSSGNPAVEADGKVQSSGCLVAKCGSTATPTDVGLSCVLTATFDVNANGKHIFTWRNNTTPANMNAKASAGTSFHLSSEATFGTTNYKRWYLDGGDTDAIGGWKCYAIDPTSTASASAGTANLAAVKTIAMLHRQATGVTTSLNNAYIDAVRIGTGLTGTASSAGDTITFNSLYSTDSLNANAWGIITQNAGIFYGAGKMTIGSASQANTCLFKDTNAVLVWRDFPVKNTLYEFNLLGASGQVTTFQLGDKDGSGNTSNGCVIRGQGAAVWNITCGSNTSFKAYASSISSLRSAVLSSTSELKNTAVSSSGTLDVNGATITSCQFASQTATQLKVDSTAEMSSITGSSFTSGGTGHAVELTVAGTYSFSNLTFNSFASSDGSTGNEAVYVSAATGSVTINVTGGNTPSIRTAGATTTVVAGAVTATLTAQTATGTAIQNANVMVKAAAGGPMPADVTVTITNSGTTATVSHTTHNMATNDKTLLKGASHLANNGIFPITKIDANSYSYTMGSAPGSNPTGTIKATFVALSGLTNASGQIAMSRVFGSNQPVTGWARKSTGSPIYKTAPVAGTISSASGASFSALLILDE